MIRRICVLLAVAALAGCGGADRVIVGAGTTTVDSGLMAALERHYGFDVSIVAGSTAELLELATQGSVDVVVVHDEAQELEFMAKNPQAVRKRAFMSSFLLVGPADLVGTLGASSVAEVMGAIAAAGYTFVTRDDGSGTHSRELALWASAGITPGGSWYVATGQGMGLTLQVADQRGGFTLVEAGVFASAAGTIDLVPVPIIDLESLANPYSAIVVTASGAHFFNWLTGEEGAAAIAAASSEIFGGPIYAATSGQ